MALPSLSQAPWISLLSPIPDISPQADFPPSATLIPVVGDVWEVVEDNRAETERESIDQNGVIFVGNWFLKDRREIFDDVFSDKPAGQKQELEWISASDLKKLRGESEI